MLCLDVCIVTTTMPQPTEITQFIFGQPLREAQPKTSSSVTLPLHPNGRAQSGACIQSITVSGRIERVADTGKPKPSRQGLRAIKTDLEILDRADLEAPDSEGVGAQTALHYRRERRAGDRLWFAAKNKSS